MHINTYMRGQPPLFTCKAHIFQVDSDTRKSWIPLSHGAVDVQIFHDSVKHVYRIVSVDGVNILINTLITARISFTKTSQKFCQWIDTKANHVYGLGFANESDLKRFMNKFFEIKGILRQASKHDEYRSNSTDNQETFQSIPTNELESFSQVQQENTRLKVAFSHSSNEAKRWYEEAEALRGQNEKLTTALEETHGHVEEWKRQLQFYRDECARLRQTVTKHHSTGDPDANESERLRSLLAHADQQNKEQETKILQLEKHIRRDLDRMESLKKRLAASEMNNHNLRNGLENPYSKRTDLHLHSPRRSRTQLAQLRDLFETKSNEFHRICTAKSHDLHRLCSQITQAMGDL